MPLNENPKADMVIRKYPDAASLFIVFKVLLKNKKAAENPAAFECDMSG